MSATCLETDFYTGEDVVSISRALLGKVLCTRIDGLETSAIITETEAYAGITDKGSHAYGNRRTKRTEPLYGPGGRAYIYLCYGIHHLFNVVTNQSGVPHAVLVRGGKALVGKEVMGRRRKKSPSDRSLLNGPGCLARALGITTSLTGTDLTEQLIWIEDRGIAVEDHMIQVSQRIGIDYAGEDALLPYRFILKQ